MKFFICLNLIIIGYNLGLCVSFLIDLLIERKISKDVVRVYKRKDL